MSVERRDDQGTDGLTYQQLLRELQALRAHPQLPRRPDPHAVWEELCLDFPRVQVEDLQVEKEHILACLQRGELLGGLKLRRQVIEGLCWVAQKEGGGDGLGAASVAVLALLLLKAPLAALQYVPACLGLLTTSQGRAA